MSSKQANTQVQSQVNSALANSAVINGIQAEIVFNQYLIVDASKTQALKEYDFYEVVTGYSNFSDMFK